MTAMTRSVPRLALNRTEVAIAIGVSADSVDEMVAEGALPPPRRWHKRRLWLVTELEACLTDLPADGQHGREEKANASDDEDWSAEL